MTAAKMPRHLILDVSYSRDSLTCSCGAVMRAELGFEWADHRRTEGEKVRSIGQTTIASRKGWGGKWSMRA